MPNHEPEYPKPFWLPDNPNPVYAHREKDETGLRSQGYADRAPYFEYPKALYHPDTQHIEVAQDKAGEKALIVRGYTTKPVAPKAETAAPTDPVVLQAKLDAQAEIIKQLLAERDLKDQAKKH